MMTLHKLHAGDGYTYLTRQVAAGDEGRSPGQKLADYYTASGNPAGRWIGAGAADLAVAGRVREDQMRALFGKGMHPDADQIIAFELAAGHTQAEAERAAKLGRAFPNYTPLPPRAERVTQRVTGFANEHGRPPTSSERSRIEAEEARRDRRAVAGYDLVFTPVKSASLLWALGSAATREQIETAHHEAVADTLAWLERETAFARIGDAGQAQIETRGFLAAAFDHRDSRAGDPNLHTHVAISNKVRARDDHADGRPRWLSLDARVIHAAAVAASERYNTRLEEAMARRLGVEFTERADSIRRDKRSVREIAGVPVALIKHFSRRRAAIEDRYRELASDYRHTHGHEPPREAQLKLAQQATLETRDGKAAPTSLAAQITGWRDEAAAVLGDDQLADLEPRALNRQIFVTALADLPVDQIASTVLTVVSEEKATWTRWNLIAETERHRTHDPDNRRRDCPLTSQIESHTNDCPADPPSIGAAWRAQQQSCVRPTIRAELADTMTSGTRAAAQYTLVSVARWRCFACGPVKQLERVAGQRSTRDRPGGPAWHGEVDLHHRGARARDGDKRSVAQPLDHVDHTGHAELAARGERGPSDDQGVGVRSEGQFERGSARHGLVAVLLGGFRAGCATYREGSRTPRDQGIPRIWSNGGDRISKCVRWTR